MAVMGRACCRPPIGNLKVRVRVRVRIRVRVRVRVRVRLRTSRGYLKWPLTPSGCLSTPSSLSNQENF